MEVLVVGRETELPRMEDIHFYQSVNVEIGLTHQTQVHLAKSKRVILYLRVRN
jgi:hypothetical protein